MARRASRTGFTIVELLIVVVVIAILAAITIVAYNGITNRAKNSAASSAAESAAKKVMTFAVTNSDSYPATLADSGVTDGNGTTYQYRVDNTANPKTFCVTATANSVSYFVSSANATPTSGACAGHGANGIAPVTNWSINPSFETNASSYGRAGSSTASATHVRSTTRSHSGGASLQQDITGTGQTGLQAQVPSSQLRINEGESAAWSFWMYSTKAGTITPYCDGALVASGYAGLSGAPTVSVAANTWVKVVGYGTRPVGSGDMFITQCGGYNLNVVSTDQVWYDEFIITKGSTQQNYADGNSSNWIWNGTVNNSTSTGPQV
ncbi:hypothetical protein BGO17_00520 [Candidatus Saccharibacteria bacterium 49-20]|nr:MAG: hypothetical protein BGO17_00520 [Candidatus Saccharibacteria bacterium 49-20]